MTTTKKDWCSVEVSRDDGTHRIIALGPAAWCWDYVRALDDKTGVRVRGPDDEDVPSPSGGSAEDDDA
jgi:hypothetical protein